MTDQQYEARKMYVPSPDLCLDMHNEGILFPECSFFWYCNSNMTVLLLNGGSEYRTVAAKGNSSIMLPAPTANELFAKIPSVVIVPCPEARCKKVEFLQDKKRAGYPEAGISVELGDNLSEAYARLLLMLFREGLYSPLPK